MKRLASLLVWVLIAAILSGAAPGRAFVNASGWAQPELAQAEELKLLPAELLAADQSEPISRLAFAKLAVSLWETVAKQDAPLAPEETFSDTRDFAVRKAAALGIVNGVSAGVFAPALPIQRQQLAVMLSRTMDSLLWTPAESETKRFADDGEIAGYAKDAVYRLRALEIFNGDDRNCANPSRSITNEQAAVLTLRAYLTITGAQAEEAARLRINGRNAWLSMPESKLKAIFGLPEETLDSGQGFLWYIYGIKTYESFFMAGVQNGSVCALFAAYGDFAYLGMRCGEKAATALPASKKVVTKLVEPAAHAVTKCYDGGDALYAVLLRPEGSGNGVNAASCPDGGRLLMHMANALRVHEGKSALLWSGEAARVAQLHSADMAAREELGHDSSAGDSLSERMTAGGVSWSSIGENIGRVPGGDLLSLYHEWSGAPGYRANLLNEAFMFTGADGAYNKEYYFAMEFYQP